MKKRSGGSTKPLEGFTFFVEVSLGRRVAERLREAGFRIVTHTDVLRADATDEEWVAVAAKNRWIVLTKDGEIRRKANEVEAVLRAGLRVFVLTRGNWTSEEMSGAFIAAASRMGRLLGKQAGAFIARITKQGELATIFPAPTGRLTGHQP